MATPADDAAIREAAHWYVQLSASDHSAHDQLAWHKWLVSDPRHAAAWQHVEALRSRMAPLPKGLGKLLLHQNARRRGLTSGMVCVFLGLVVWSLAGQQTGWLTPDAAFVTRQGERRSVVLAEGTHLLLNTNSKVVVRYGLRQRTVRLEHGELLIRTQSDNAAIPRPFVVETAHGQIRALGTRFSVRAEPDQTRVTVQEHAIVIEPHTGRSTLRLNAGQAASFSGIKASPEKGNAEEPAWAEGRLSVLQQPLKRFAKELSRYRSQPIVVDQRLESLQVSGNFSIDAPDRSLRAAVAHLPVRIVHIEDGTLQVLPR